MPKIIKDLQPRLLEEAKKQIESDGYSAMTIRFVAKSCGVGVGTVYNYFPSKDDLVAAYMLEDWNKCITAIYEASAYSDDPMPVVCCIWDQLRAFVQLHNAVFQDRSACASFSRSFNKYHTLLRSQLALPLRKFSPDAFTADFLAEAILTWSMAGKTCDEVLSVIRKLFL